MKNIIVKRFSLLIFAILLLLPSRVQAQKTTAKLTVIDKASDEIRSEASLFVRIDQTTKEVSQIVLGKGDDGDFKNTRFKKTSTLLDERLLSPVKTQVVYYNEKDEQIGSYSVDYNYQDNIATFSKLDGQKKERLRKAYKIKGPICDALNMPIFLERFLVFHQNLTYDHFYLISFEPKLYKVKVFYRGTDNLSIDGKIVPARKIQLIGDMGPLTEIAAKYLPKTHLWYTPKPPYRWLKYEGLERGPDSVTIEVHVHSN